LIGFIAGIMLSIFVAFFREFLDDTIKDPEVAKRTFGLPLLVAIPYIETERHLDRKDDEIDRILITDHQPKSSVSEVFRSLRTSIHFTSISKRKQIILITSSFPGEGKTTIIGNFAVSLSQLGSRILLMDCDLRRPTLHTIFGYTKTPGLTDCLAGDIEIEQAVHKTGINGIDFLSAGTTPPNPVELLGSDKMQTLLESLRSKYDYILIDAPPMLAVTDAHLLARKADMIVLALQAGKVSTKVASRMRELLASIGTPIAGLVINDRSKSKMDLYGYGDKYYGYGYYGYGYGESSAEGGKRKRWEKWASRLKKWVKR
jgi:tyrosine-protein kinase Etk/Wzc